MSYRVHSVIIVEDSGRNEATSISRTNFRYQLTQPVNFYKRGKQYEYFCRIEDVRIPISFYNINNNYNTFGFTASATGVVSVDITQGNYTIDELITEVQLQFNLLDNNTYTITYDEITQKVNIASTGTEDISVLVGDGWQTIGFDLSETITGASNVTGVNVAYTNTVRHLRLHVDNVVSNNIYSNDFTAINGKKQTNLQRVSLVIPITQTRNEFQFFDNHTGYYIKLPNMASIGDLNIRLTDAENNTLDLHNVPFGFNLVIYKLKKPKF